MTVTNDLARLNSNFIPYIIEIRRDLLHTSQYKIPLILYSGTTQKILM